ncbi:MAG TPA: protein kinase [Bryobacteraceae bacterium]|nr:protein kinase [Bryobacteraceae bacterium]
MPNKAQDDDLVMSLVELALARAPEERERYLHSACAHNSQLFEEVRKYVEWEERMNGFLLEPLYPAASFEPTFEPEELIDARFRIVQEVARGGMGIVYEAVDERLERRIAIKCAKPGFRKRLPPEVRHATEVSHPNVCKIYEIHTASTDRGEIDFITMEFLEGETLAERLRRGRLPEAHARAIAQQLCAGLAAAHRNQVIHGDLKSNNVILTTAADGAIRAVITDFGLARRPEATGQTVRSGAEGGTPDYMAPELWKGEKVTVASDIYALGVILYELASGQTPFRSKVTVSWDERLSPRPPAVNPKWDRVLARCLAADPARRFQSAQEVGQALAPHSRRWLLAAAAAIVLAAVSGVVTYQRATAPKESARLAMLPFESDPNTATLTDGLSRDTANQLDRLRGNARTSLTVIPLADILRKHADTTGTARALLDATHILRTTVNRQGGKIAVHAYLIDAHSGVNTKDWSAEYALGQLHYVPVALAGVVTETLRLPPLAVTATVNAAAQQDYWNGLYYLRRNSTVDKALVLIQRAITGAPDWALPYTALGEAQWYKYDLTKDRSWLQRAADSVREAENRNPDLPQAHRVAGLLQYETGRYEQAAGEFFRAIELDPGNSDAYRWLGLEYQRNNQFPEALAAYQRAIELDPQDFRNYQFLAAFYNKRSNYSEAATYYRKAVLAALNEPDAHFGLASAYMNSGDFPKAESEMRLAIGLQPTITALHTLGVVLMYQGRDPEAVQYILQALMIGPERYLWWMNLGTAYRRMNLISESDRAYRRGLELAKAELINNPRSGYLKSHLAFLYARTADKPSADSEIGQALHLSPNDADVLWMAAATYEALGRRDDTLNVLRASPNGVVADVSRWPDMAGLHNDSRFLQLLASGQIK